MEYTLGYADVVVSVTSGGTIMKRSSLPIFGDNPAHEPPLFCIAVNPSMLDWLIEELESKTGVTDDGYVKWLKERREEYKHVLWDRVSGRQ